MTSVLYISYTGLLDPLGESQVLQYVASLASKHRMTLLTFEKSENTSNAAALARMERICAQAGVEWHRRVWHRKPPLPATAWDVFWGSTQAIDLARSVDARIVHCRSYVGSLIGLRVKRATGAKLIFDMRGFWADERADTGRWDREGAVYKSVKKIERTLFTEADYVVSLTRAGVREFEQFDYLANDPPPSSVIPTCTNLDLFRPDGEKTGPFTLGYIGSVGGWYLFDQVAQAVARLQQRDPQARFLAVNKGGHDLIHQALERADADMSRCEITTCAYDEVGAMAARMHAGVFFIMPAWSKRASCPTRMGEFLGSGIPCLANGGVGDVEEDFTSSGTGVVMPTDPDGRVMMDSLDEAIDRLLALANDPTMLAKCRSTAEQLFSLSGGVAEYDRIYQLLASQ
ncbi:glycosyltransferase [Qipengyuania sp. CAU 1752]